MSWSDSFPIFDETQGGTDQRVPDFEDVFDIDRVVHPGQDGPMTFWKSSSSRGPLREWQEHGRPMWIEMFLEWMRDIGRFEVMELSASAQGWRLK